MLRVCFNPADWGLQCHGTNDIRIRLNGGCPTHLVSLLVWVCIGQNWDTNGPTDMRVLLNIIYISLNCIKLFTMVFQYLERDLYRLSD